VTFYNKRVEYSSYLIYFLGIFLDYVTTKIGVSNFHLIEANAVTIFLMQRGLWLTTNLLIFLVIMLSSSYVLKKGDISQSYLVLASPTMCGLARILIGVHNFILIIS
jgi:hypothetical protein